MLHFWLNMILLLSVKTWLHTFENCAIKYDKDLILFCVNSCFKRSKLDNNNINAYFKMQENTPKNENKDPIEVQH